MIRRETGRGGHTMSGQAQQGGVERREWSDCETAKEKKDRVGAGDQGGGSQD